jgi:hypothetical protein
VSAPKFGRSIQLGLLFDLAARVPPLLQASDSTSNHPNHALLESLSILQQELETWLTSASINNRRNGDSPLDLERASLEYSDQPEGIRAALQIVTRESLCRICLLLVAECVDALLSHRSSATHSATAVAVRAIQLRRTTQALARATKVQFYVARLVSAPLYFLARYYAQTEDTAGLEWCAQFKGDILETVPWIRWDVLLPWSLSTIYDMPSFRE